MTIAASHRYAGGAVLALAAAGMFVVDRAATPPVRSIGDELIPSLGGVSIEPEQHAPPRTVRAVADQPLVERIEQMLDGFDYADAPDQLWNAYDELALDHFNRVGNIDEAHLEAWLRRVPPAHEEFTKFGAFVAPNRIVIVWSDRAYLAGARASLFVRAGDSSWTVHATHDIELTGRYVSLAWRRGAVLLIAGVLRGADAQWVSLVGLELRDDAFRQTLRIEDIYLGDTTVISDGISIATIVDPHEFVTHLFTHWREQEVHIRWTGQGFRVTRRDTEPVIDLLRRLCALRRANDPRAAALVRGDSAFMRRLPMDCSNATLHNLEYRGADRARAEFWLPFRCEDTDELGDEVWTEGIVLDMRKTDRWRIDAVSSSSDPSCRPYRQAR
jgi:hypothetical protein